MGTIERDFARGFKPKLYIYEDLFLQVFKRLDSVKHFGTQLTDFLQLIKAPSKEKMRGMEIMAAQKKLKIFGKKMSGIRK